MRCLHAGARPAAQPPIAHMAGPFPPAQIALVWEKHLWLAVRVLNGGHPQHLEMPVQVPTLLRLPIVCFDARLRRRVTGADYCGGVDGTGQVVGAGVGDPCTASGSGRCLTMP